MVIRLKDSSFFHRLRKRFNLDDMAIGLNVEFKESVQPVTQVDDLLKVPEIAYANGDLTGALGGYVAYFNIPAGQRWIVLSAYRQGCIVASSIVIRDEGSTTVPLTTVLIAEQTWVGRVILDQNWSIGCTATGNGGDGTRALRVHYLVEKAY